MMVLYARKYSQIYVLSVMSDLSLHQTYSEPSVAILGLDLGLVAHPVSVPSPEGCRVVDTNSIDSLNLESGALE